MFDNNDLQLVLCPVGGAEEKYRHLYHKIYKCWSQVWDATYNEVSYKKESDYLKSDAFTRQDFTTAVFYKNECVALMLYRDIDINLQTAHDDSFFAQWGETHIKSLLQLGQRFVIASNLAVSPGFRSKNLGFSLKDFTVGLVAEVTLHSNADATIATPRRDRNVHESCYDWGAITIADDVSWGCGIQVDLVAFCQKKILLRREHELRPLIDKLWRNKIIVQDNVYGTLSQLCKKQTSDLQNTIAQGN